MVIDSKTAIKNFQDNQKLFFGSLAKIEVNVLNSSMELLSTSFDSNDWNQVKTILRKLYASVAYVGAGRVFYTCDRMIGAINS